MINSCLHITYVAEQRAFFNYKMLLLCFNFLCIFLLQFSVYQENTSDFGYFSLEREIGTRNKQKKKKKGSFSIIFIIFETLLSVLAKFPASP